MRESLVEAYFVRRVKEAGGLQRKFVSPGHRGVPDRIVVFKGSVFFVELKRLGGELEPHQVREHARLREFRASVWVLYCEEDVDRFITLLELL